MDGFDNDAIERILAYLRAAKASGRQLARAERRKISHQIEVFEKRFQKFLQDTAEIAKLREDAKAAVAQGATNGLSSDQVDALNKYLANSEEIAAQRAAVERMFLKFATARALLNGERGN